MNISADPCLKPYSCPSLLSQPCQLCRNTVSCSQNSKEGPPMVSGVKLWDGLALMCPILTGDEETSLLFLLVWGICGFSCPPLSLPSPPNLHWQDRSCCQVPFVFRGGSNSLVLLHLDIELEVLKVLDKLLYLGWKREMVELRAGWEQESQGGLLALSDGKCHQSN